jgi:LPS export ABC transporter permease LptF/LPS export ABC transporter permease LptG
VFRILDRYLLREILLPFTLGLVVLTFVLEIPPILREGEALIAKGVAWSTIARVLVNLLPQALSVTIPMAVLLGILVGFGRLSGDREFVALQASGVSLLRLLRPVAVVAIVSTAWTAYETIVALPDSNQTFREIAYGVVATRVESNVRPGIFFEDFPDLVIYVRELPQGGGWRDVFIADNRDGGKTTVYFAREGRIVLDRDHKLVQLQLIQGTSHTTTLANREELESSEFGTISISLDPNKVFPPPPAKGAPEMTFAELRQAMTDAAAHHDPGYSPRFMYQQKLSLPATCPILALIGLALGASNRKDGKLAGFVLGMGVIVAYYILLYGARAAAMGGRLNPEWAPWLPNIIMGAIAILMVALRSRLADQPIRLSVPVFWRRRPPDGDLGVRAVPTTSRPQPRVVVVIRVPHFNLPRPRLLDVYVAREYLRIFFLGIAGLLTLFYISTFIDVADKLFRGQATSALLVRFFYYRTPLYVYYVIPMAVLVAVLVTIGVMTKNSELIVMRACGISLYRTAAPVAIFALAMSGVLFALQERALAYANREAYRLESIIRGWPPVLTALDRRWLIGSRNDLYHYDLFDPVANRFTRLYVYHIDESAWRLGSILEADEAVLVRRPEAGDSGTQWKGRHGWLREFVKSGAGKRATVKYTAFDERSLALEPVSYFKSESPDPDQMTYAQLRAYVTRLQASGADAVPSIVALQRKLAFPFVTIILTMLAVPFAVTTGRRGALYGIGIGLVLAITYWILLSVFGALGAGGVLSPLLAAWAPNILFGAAAAYLILTVKT